MRLTLIQPAIGRRASDRRYLKSWQMEPLAPAVLARLTPPEVEIRFYDDRLEAIPFDEPTELAALSVETYTAQRSYQISSEYRRRGVPVALGGFHPSLCTDEALRYGDAVVVGEAEELWPRLVDDFRHGKLQRIYRHHERPSLVAARPDRGLFRGKRYLPMTLVETGRGCPFHCEFCSIQSYFHAERRPRPVGDVLAEIEETRARTRLFFFVDDNITADRPAARELFHALRPLGIRWVSQASLDAAHDEELLRLMVASGCQGLLVGFETLEGDNLAQMGKGFNAMKGGYEAALANLRRHRIGLYATFVFGYDHDTSSSFSTALEFARRHRFYLAAFNHLVPFPGTPLFRRLQMEGRLLSEAWWRDPDYCFNQIAFKPQRLQPEELRRLCLEARRRFYSLAGILRRWADPVNRSRPLLARAFPAINLLLRREVEQRDGLPLGEEGWSGPLIECAGHRLLRKVG